LTWLLGGLTVLGCGTGSAVGWVDAGTWPSVAANGRWATIRPAGRSSSGSSFPAALIRYRGDPRGRQLPGLEFPWRRSTCPPTTPGRDDVERPDGPAECRVSRVQVRGRLRPRPDEDRLRSVHPVRRLHRWLTPSRKASTSHAQPHPSHSGTTARHQLLIGTDSAGSWRRSRLAPRRISAILGTGLTRGTGPGLAWLAPGPARPPIRA
jgi:hypothetical protein